MEQVRKKQSNKHKKINKKSVNTRDEQYDRANEIDKNQIVVTDKWDDTRYSYDQCSEVVETTQSTSEKLEVDTNLNDAEEKNVECDTKENEELKKVPIKENVKDTSKFNLATIRPYTETQLSAFYTNNELSMIEDFTDQFTEAELQGLAAKAHPLYEMLSNYLSVRGKLNENNAEINQLKKEYEDMKTNLWSSTFPKVFGKGECPHGEKVTTSHTYRKCTLNTSAWQSMLRILTRMQQCILENHILYSFSAENLKIQIEIYVQTVITHCLSVTQVNKHKEITLSMQPEPEHWQPYLTDLRLCISILFAFQRKMIKDNGFTEETRAWLTRLVAVLLRIANYQDHLFLLSHILRCPGRVGNWGSSFVQTPLVQEINNPFVSYEINHILAVLAIILSPVKDRDHFLGEIAQSKDEAQEALWVVIDSDGEEDEESSGTSLRENDLVALINQLPLASLFSALSLIDDKRPKDLNEIEISEQHILRFFAFSTLFVKIINKGLRTYDHPRYAQFAKRLSRLILHIVQYATDQWEIFCATQSIQDAAMKTRLQVEYDAFFLRAIYCLYASQKLGAWQFLSVLPYESVSLTALWKIFYFLHGSDVSAEELLSTTHGCDFSVYVGNRECTEQFVEKLSCLPDGEVYYLLNAFANVALARTEQDLVVTATLDLLQIGFINEATRDLCSKTSRIFLTHITSKHTHLLPLILRRVRENIDEISDLALYLYEELPLAIWEINDADIEQLSKLITARSESQTETKLARMIISRLNWDFKEDGTLFLPYHVHRDVALLVLQAVDDEPAFSNWGWQTILRLKLHISDNGFKNLQTVLDIENYNVISKGVKDKKPLHGFVALLLTSWGHLIPLICTKGFEQLLFLESQQKYEAVLFVLYLIMPMFLNAQECIVNCLDFQEILSNLLYVDQSYTSMAKSLIGSHSTILQQFGNMIETHLRNYANYGLDSPRVLVRLWMNSLVSVDQWTKNYGVLYLLDVIIKASFFHKDALEAASDVLKELLQDTTPQEQGGAISSILKWVSSNQNASLITSSLSSFPWLAYVIIGIEHEERERRTGLWKELLQQLQSQKGKTNVDSAIKKAANVCKISSVSSGSLCIYRYAQQALDTSIDHPILALIWQKFFQLFFEQLPNAGRSIGDKFFEGMINFNFLKKMKSRLQETIRYYNNRVDEAKEDASHSAEHQIFLDSCLKAFVAFELWLEEPRLHNSSSILRCFPPQYEQNLLSLLMRNEKAAWYEFIDYDRVKKEQEECIRIWRISNFRESSNVNKPLLDPEGSERGKDPVRRILKRIESYQVPKPPPAIELGKPVVPAVDVGSLENMHASLENHFRVLKKYSDTHFMNVSNCKEYNGKYQELIPKLFELVNTYTKKVVKCEGKKQNLNCSGVVVHLEYAESRMNKKISELIRENRENYESVLATNSKPVWGGLCNSAVAIEHTVRILEQQRRLDSSRAELGVELFYHILKLIDERSLEFLPTKTLFVTCLEKLGKSHIRGVELEIPRLLDKILKEPHLGQYLAPHFLPGNVGTSNLLLMYGQISDEIGQKYDVSFALLSKFDIDKWLHNKKPKLNQRSKFIEQVVKGLSTLGTEPQVEALTLHGLYRKHLLSVFQFQFPEHYGEILVCLLRSSGGETSPVAISVWIDVLNSLACPTQIHPKNPLRDQLRTYAQNQQKLNYREILETSELLSRHFARERLQYGLYGLYPKCARYLDVYCLLLGMTGHAMIVNFLNAHQGLESDKMCDKIWPYIRDMFAPWIAPYSMQNMKDYMASWIQQLTDDRSVLLPWIPSNVLSAQKMLDVFKECVLFLLHVLPACSVILNHIWQWYVATYAHSCVKEHTLNVVHHTLLVLPWHNFWPSVNDLEAMLRIVDQYLPECHEFLGQIFVSVQWTGWMSQFGNCPMQIKSRVYHCYVNLLVKLSNEPNIRFQHVQKFNALLVQSEQMDWDVLDPGVYQHVMDWYIMSCDSSVIFKSDPLDLDVRVLEFVKKISGYTVIVGKENPNILNKRYIYVRSFVKLISVYTSRNKLVIPSKEREICAVIDAEIEHMESVVESKEELVVILSELLQVLNVNALGDMSLKCVTRWISKKNGNDPAIETLLGVSDKAVKNYEYIGKIYELALECYFQNVNEHYQPTWTQVKQYGKIVTSNQIEFAETLLVKDNILTLNLILIEKIASCNELQSLLKMCIDWLRKIKISDSVESKVPLIWLGIVKIALKYCEIDEPVAGGLLYKFSQVLLETAEDKGGSGWGRGFLNAIGINRPDTISLPFRFLCRALGGYILAQLPEMKGKPQVVRRRANAPSKVGQPGGNTECAKILLKLDFGQSQGKLKEYAELALNEIQDPGNSLHNVEEFLILMSNLFFTKSYFKDLSKS